MVKYSLTQHKKVGIFGLGITGTTAFRSLNQINEVICWDDSALSIENFQNDFGANYLFDLSNPKWLALDKILISPGVPPSHRIFDLARKNNIAITSDVDLFYEANRLAKFIAITGTNGKSTTTALVEHILRSNGLEYPTGGNIGKAALELPSNMKGYVLELSSFQIELLTSFRTDIAVLLNITPDHLDHHKNMAEYIKIKRKLLESIKDNGFCVTGVDNVITDSIFKELSLEKDNIVPISALNIQKGGVAAIVSKLYDNIDDNLILDIPGNKFLQGVHNHENIAASYAVCRILGISPKLIMNSIATFTGLPHRMQYIGRIGMVNFYNDSKATNADSAEKSLAVLDNVYWLLGGISKEGGIVTLEKFFHKIKKAYIFGRDKEIFANTLQGKIEIEICDNLLEASNKALTDALQNQSDEQNILLAPACSSYDQFKNFEQRGNVFIEFCIEKMKLYESSQTK